MYRGRKIIICIPAGRRKYMQILLKLFLDQGYPDIVDECQMWLNTTNFDDIQWIKSFSRTTGHPWVQLKSLPAGVAINPQNLWWTVCKFYKFAQDADTIYMKIDDDTVLVDSLHNFKKLLDFRIDNPQYLLVSANVLNNSICTFFLQSVGTSPVGAARLPHITYDSHDKMGMSGTFAEALHDLVIQNGFDLEKFHFTGNQEVADFKRVCINCIVWFGEDMADLEEIPKEDEIYLSTTAPSLSDRKVCVFGEYTVCHFGYGTQQRHLLENTNLLARYHQKAFGCKGDSISDCDSPSCKGRLRPHEIIMR